MFRWPVTLEGKFTITAVSCIILTIAVASWWIFDREEKLYIANAYQQANVLTETSRLTLTNIMVYNELKIMDNQDMIDYFDYYILNLSEKDPRIKCIAILDTHGKVITHKDINSLNKRYHDREFISAMKENKPVIRTSDKNDKILVITAPLNVSTKQWGAIRISLSLEEMHQRIDVLKQEIIVLAVLLVLFAMIIVKAFAKHLSKPIIKLSGTMNRIKNHEDMNITVAKGRRDEIGELEHSFYWLIRRLKELDEEKERTFEQFIQNEKLVSLGYLSAGVAHEINNPLGGVMLCFNRLQKYTAVNTETEQLVFGIDDSLKKMKHIVEQLLDFSRSAKAEKKYADVNALIENLLVLVGYEAQRRNVKITCEFDPDLGRIELSENKISQVIMNIAINAFQSMPEGGTFNIKTRKLDGKCRISLKDTGSGISDDILPYIFDPFFSTKNGQGTGLGLSVSKGIIDQHGGSIEVKTEAGKGCEFIITLPLDCKNGDTDE
ncbi:ATP-binding protein [Seleniivibrio woodruffii]|uniref:ATP-binding protein n=1 Tax=Seleniivibrio woodruffii TaxID=1078050 RepID=UPI0016442321|nr:ATP-binding protein [Seleniivibrio woodruffii]